MAAERAWQVMVESPLLLDHLLQPINHGRFSLSGIPHVLKKMKM
jgi:hypothetical protein